MSKMVVFLAFGLVTLGFLYSGAYNIYNAVRYRTVPVTTLAETPAQSLPTFVTLKDIAVDVRHLMKLKIGYEIIYIPVRAKGAAPDSRCDVVIFTTDRNLIVAAQSGSPELAPHLLALARRTEVTGRVTGNEKSRKSLHEANPLISPDVVIIDEGATPSPVFGGIMLTIGLGLSAIILGGGLRQATPPPSSAPGPA